MAGLDDQQARRAALADQVDIVVGQCALETTNQFYVALCTLVAESVGLQAYLVRRPLMTSSASARPAPCIGISMGFAAYGQCS